MLLNLRHHAVRVQIRALSAEHHRLTLDFPPGEPQYEKAVRGLVSQLLLPEPGETAPAGGPLPREEIVGDEAPDAPLAEGE